MAKKAAKRVSVAEQMTQEAIDLVAASAVSDSEPIPLMPPETESQKRVNALVMMYLTPEVPIELTPEQVELQAKYANFRIADPETRRKIVRMVYKGVTQTKASRALGITSNSLADWKRSDPIFREALEMAESHFLQRLEQQAIKGAMQFFKSKKDPKWLFHILACRDWKVWGKRSADQVPVMYVSHIINNISAEILKVVDIDKQGAVMQTFENVLARLSLRQGAVDE